MGRNMLRFEDIERHINPELQAKLHRAQDAVAERQDQLASLQEVVSKAESALETDRVRLVEAERDLQAAYRGHCGDTEALEAALSKARKAKSDVAAKVQNGQERIDDLSQGLAHVKGELGELIKLRDRARQTVVRSINLASKPPVSMADKHRLFEVESISVADMLAAYLVQSDDLTPNALRGQGADPARLFVFIAKYFANISDEEAQIMRNRFEAMIWGDYIVPDRAARGSNIRHHRNPVDLNLLKSPDFSGGSAA